MAVLPGQVGREAGYLPGGAEWRAVCVCVGGGGDGGGRGRGWRSFPLLPGIPASAVFSAQGTPDFELTSHPNPIAKAGGQVGSEKGEGGKPGADKGSARREDNCSHYLELRPKPGLPPGRGGGGGSLNGWRWMEAPRAPGVVSDPGQLLSRQAGRTAVHPDPGARAHWLPAPTGRFVLSPVQ